MLKFERLASIVALGLAMSACGGDDGEPAGAGGTSGTSQEVRVELFSWWVAPGEAEALQALIDVHRKNYPNQRIVNGAATTPEETKLLLLSRLGEGNPPDVMQSSAFNIRQDLAAHPGIVQPLDALLEAEGMSEAIVPELLEDVTLDGSVQALPVNMHRENAVFYNKQIFADNEIDPPTTLAELLAACEKLKEGGVTPIATSGEGWVLRILFNTLAMGVYGADEYTAYWTGNAELDEAKLATTIDTFDTILTQYVNADAGDEDFGWTNAAQAVFAGEAAMFLHGDWTKGYLEQLGWTPDFDFGVFAAPGARELFWYSADVFAIATGAPHESAARDFLKTVGSTEGQVAFNKIKGSSPIRLDVDPKLLDPIGRQVLDDLKSAKFRVQVRNNDAWDDGLAQFALDHDKDALLQVYREAPPQR
jgi:glucose/mannose transport system substrate-binding protein